MAHVQLECTMVGCDVKDGTKSKTHLLDTEVAVTVLGFNRYDISM